MGLTRPILELELRVFLEVDIIQPLLLLLLLLLLVVVAVVLVVGVVVLLK